MKQKLLLKTMLLLFALIAGNSSAWAQTTIWSENFDGLEADATPTTPTNTSYTGVTYTCTNGVGTSPGSTKIQNDNLAGGASAPEMMVGKKGSGTGAAGGKFTVVIPLDKYEGTLTLTYYQNKQTLKVSSPTAGVSGGQSLKPSEAGKQTTTFTGITAAMTSITIEFESTTTKNVRLDDIVLTGNKASAVATPTFDPAAGTYTSAQSVTLACATDGASIYYTTDGTTPTNASTEYTKAIDVYKTMTIKAIAQKGDDYSPVASAAYTIVSFEHAGTEADPYSVADARTAIDNNIGITGVYATGIVSEIVTAYNSTYENISFNISKDGKTTSDQLQAYRCKKGDGGSDPDVADIQVGDVVIVKGDLTKYGETYEFAQNNVLISLEHPTTPIIAATPTSLTGFTYEVGNGPSAAQNFSVSGSNLTEDITLTPTTNYEISLAEASGYASSLTIAPTAGTVDATTVYVRLKAGLAEGAQDGTISLESTGATKVKMTLSGNVTAPEAPNFTWDLSKDETATASEDELTWTSTYASMSIEKGSSTTNANNYYPGTSGKTYSSTRFYTNEILTITPAAGYQISSIVFTATSASYATALQNSTWTNATAVASDKTVTVTPTNGLSAISATIGGTCGFTEVKVYYDTTVPVTIGADEWATYVTPCALDFTGLTAYVVSAINANSVTLTEVTSAPAGTGVILNAAKGTYKLDITDSPTAVGTNELMTSRGANVAGEASGYDYYVLANKSAGVGFYKLQNGVTIPAGKCFLAVANTSAPEFLGFGGDDTTGINAVNGEGFTVNGEFYNLNGQRVAQPKKGLYIVNGKKVVIK